MTKKNLKWRLSDLPNGADVSKLVEQEIITKEEARDILFNESDSSSNEELLKKQIEFLENLVKELVKYNSSVNIPMAINTWTKTYTPALPYVVYSSSGSMNFSSGSHVGLPKYVNNLIN